MEEDQFEQATWDFISFLFLLPAFCALLFSTLLRLNDSQIGYISGIILVATTMHLVNHTQTHERSKDNANKFTGDDE